MQGRRRCLLHPHFLGAKAAARPRRHSCRARAEVNEQERYQCRFAVTHILTTVAIALFGHAGHMLHKMLKTLSLTLQSTGSAAAAAGHSKKRLHSLPAAAARKRLCSPAAGHRRLGSPAAGHMPHPAGRTPPPADHMHPPAGRMRPPAGRTRPPAGRTSLPAGCSTLRSRYMLPRTPPAGLRTAAVPAAGRSRLHWLSWPPPHPVEAVVGQMGRWAEGLVRRRRQLHTAAAGPWHNAAAAGRSRPDCTVGRDRSPADHNSRYSMPARPTAGKRGWQQEGFSGGGVAATGLRLDGTLLPACPAHCNDFSPISAPRRLQNRAGSEPVAAEAVEAGAACPSSLYWVGDLRRLHRIVHALPSAVN